MKNLLTLISIIFFSFSFSDTIVKKNGDRIVNCKILYIENFEVTYLTLDDRGKNEIPCVSVEQILNEKNEVIDFECKRQQTNYFITPEEKEAKKILKYQKGFIGGGFIAVGSTVLLINLESECGNCGLDIEKWDDFNASVKTKQQMGYILIAIGGILVALGI